MMLVLTIEKGSLTHFKASMLARVDSRSEQGLRTSLEPVMDDIIYFQGILDCHSKSLTSMHSSRMRTARLLTVSLSVGDGVSALRGVCLGGG